MHRIFVCSLKPKAGMFLILFRMGGWLYVCAGDALHIYSHFTSRVLPTGGGDYSSNIPRCASTRQVSNLRHDTCLHQVSTELFLIRIILLSLLHSS